MSKLIIAIFGYVAILIDKLISMQFLGSPECPNNRRRDDMIDLERRALPLDVLVPLANEIGFGPV